jgi:flagellar biosynthesis protein
VSAVEPRRPLAVALKYERPSVPRVVAVGRGPLGEKIIETARENGVPLEENPARAEALSKVELDEEIPEALYKAVAVVLSFILRAAEEARVAPASGASPPR